MTWYADGSLILNTDHLIEAHPIDGSQEYDGVYLLMCTIKHGEHMKEVSGIYKTAESRNAAHLAIGMLVVGVVKSA